LLIDSCADVKVLSRWLVPAMYNAPDLQFSVMGFVELPPCCGRSPCRAVTGHAFAGHQQDQGWEDAGRLCGRCPWTWAGGWRCRGC